MRGKGRRPGETGKGKRQRNQDDDPDFLLGGSRRQHQPAAAAGAVAEAMATLPAAAALDAHHVLDASMLSAGVVDISDQAAAGAIAIDPGVLSAIVATDCDCVTQTFIGPDGQPIQAVTLEPGELQQHLAHLAATGVIAVDDLMQPLQQQIAEHERAHMEGIKQADMLALQNAKRAGTLITVNFTLDLPPELDDLELGDRQGMIEVPQGGDVPQLKRLFMYQAQNRLLPGLQVLISEHGCEMPDYDDTGNPVALSSYGVTNGSRITLRIVIPDDIDGLPLVDDAIVSAAYGSGAIVQHGKNQPGRKTRWTQEQIEALIEGVERHGLSAWRTIVQDPRLAGKNNMQCKDKFRNLCLTIIQGRPERGLTLDWQLKERVRQLIEQENIKF